MWIDKYAPTTINEMVGNTVLLSQLSSLCNSETAVQFSHIIMSGPSGVGKTTLANLIIQNQLKGVDSNMGLLCFNSADDRSIQVIRDRIYQFVPRKVPDGKRKIVLFEQADQLGEGVQQLMRTLMEKYATHTSFLFVCDKLHGMIEAVQSRCMIYKLEPIKTAELVSYLENIAIQEGVAYESPDVLRVLADLTNGDIRQCVNYLQVCAAACSNPPVAITVKTVQEMCVFPHLQKVACIFRDVETHNLHRACMSIIELYNSGYTAMDIIMFLNAYILMHPIQDKDMHILVMKEIAVCHGRVSVGIDSKIQLCGMLARISHGLAGISTPT